MQYVIVAPGAFAAACCYVPFLQSRFREAVRPWVLKNSDAQLEFVRWCTQLHNPLLSVPAAVAAFSVTTDCFLILLPSLLWLGYIEFGLKLLFGLAICLHFVCCYKDLLSCPRPALSASGFSAAEHDHELHEEFGAPSLHAAATLWLSWEMLQFAIFLAPGLNTVVSYLVVLGWNAWVCASRLYLGVHYPVDLLLGIMLSMSMMQVWAVLHPYYFHWLATSSSTPVNQLVLHTFLLYGYPVPQAESVSCGFTQRFLGAAYGAAVWFNAASNQDAGLGRGSILALHTLGLPARWYSCPLLVRFAACFGLVLVGKVLMGPALKRLFAGLLQSIPESVRQSWNPPILQSQKGEARKGATAGDVQMLACFFTYALVCMLVLELGPVIRATAV